MEHLHARFVAADGSGSDGAIAFEATEVATTSRGRTLVPVRPAEPLAGAPDRSPIPLADNVQAAGAVVTAAAGTARVAAGGALERVVARVHELMPRRKPAYRRVTPLASRRETQRRAAVAALALIAVVGGLGLAVYAFGGTGQQAAISSINAGQEALEKAQADLDEVAGPGIDLVEDDPDRARDLLTEAYEQLDLAADAGIAARTIEPVREDVVENLDRLFGVVPVATTDLFPFVPAEGEAPFDLRALVRGPDGAPYVIDAATKSVYRVDLKRKKATAVLRAGKKAGGTTVATPRFLAVGGRDLLILDAKNVLWRWRPSNDAGKGTLGKVTVNGARSWGDDVTAMGTFLRDRERGLYNLYVVDPSEQQIRAYSPSADGGGFPQKSSGWLDTARPVDKISALYIDGDVFMTDDGALRRYTSGKGDGWDAAEPEDELLRPSPAYGLLAGVDESRKGVVYAYDRPNARVVAYDKASGDFVNQYRLAGGDEAWEDLRGFYVLQGVDEDPSMMVWLSPTGVHQVILREVPDAAPSPSPSGSGSPAGSGVTSPAP
jgi:hypothetical protein